MDAALPRRVGLHSGASAQLCGGLHSRRVRNWGVLRYTDEPMKYLLMLACLLLGMVGCSSTETRTYDISVRNSTDHPITIWLTKDGPPAEKGWRSPEEIAISAPGHEERIGGMVVPAGKTAYTEPVKGEFEPGCYAWIRVYDGKYSSFSELLAVSAKSPDRYDYALDVGKNSLVVLERNGRVVVEADTNKQPSVPAGK